MSRELNGGCQGLRVGVNGEVLAKGTKFWLFKINKVLESYCTAECLWFTILYCIL